MSDTSLNDRIMEFYDRLASWESCISRDSGATLQQTHALAAIGSAEPSRMKDLAGRLGVTMGTVTILVKRLTAEGLVLRAPNPKDARSHLLTLTARGRKLLRKHLSHHESLAAEFASALSQKEAKSLKRILEKLNAAF